MDMEKILINQLKSPYIGDDGAVIDDKVYSCDAFCEGRHFLRDWLSIEEIGRKSVLVNISDVIAMNAKGKYALLAISIPQDFNKQDVELLINSIEDELNRWNIELIGGDSVGGDRLNISLTIISISNNPLFRKGLEDKDLLAYTGELGSVKRDLEALFKKKKISKDSKFIRPKLRDSFIYSARQYLKVGMDISDGLYCDLNKLLDINDLGFIELLNISEDIGLSGEEYEMLIGFDPKYLDKIQEIAKKTNTPLTIFAKASNENRRRYPCYSHHF
jgi:thiamine-monophosphate kinase